jgi:hypothetical protein
VNGTLKAGGAIFVLASQLLAGSARTPEGDQDAIRRVVQHYLDVTDKKDEPSIARAFHPDAKLMSPGDTGLRQMTLAEWWARVSRIPAPVPRKSSIALLDVTDMAAVVRVDFGASTDYLSLLKLDGEWKIVNKILSRPIRAGRPPTSEPAGPSR